MTIRDLIDSLTIQGAFRVYWWDYENNDAVILAEGHDFESDNYNIKPRILGKRIAYMYAVDGVQNIEIEWRN